MLKITRLLLLTAVIGSALTINAMDLQLYKNTVIVLPDLTGSQSSLDLKAIFNVDQYEIVTIEQPITNFKWLTDYQYKQEINKQIERIEKAKPYNQIIFFASKKITPFALHYIAQNHTKINGVLLENPTYDSDYPISDISKESIVKKPIIMITDADSPHYNDSKNIYTSLAVTKGDLSAVDYNVNDMYCFGTQNVHHLIPTALENSKSLTLDKTIQRHPAKQDILSVTNIKNKERTTYLLNCSLKLCGGGLLVYLIYKNWRS